MSNPNLANFVVVPFAAAASATDAMLFKMDPGWGNLLNVKIESLDDNVDVVAKIQSSEDGSSYADVAGATATVKPRGAAAYVAAVGPYFKLVVSGGYGRAIISLDSPHQEVTPM